MGTKSISTSVAISACDVCGRTLLRGEHAQVYVSGGTRRSVCELCTSRALHGGWVREGTVPSAPESSARVDRRRTLLGRLRPRRDPGTSADTGSEPDDEPRPARAPRAARSGRPVRAPRSSPAGQRSDGASRNGARRPPSPNREPRHVRAVPTNLEHKVSSVVSLFNSSEHPRKVAGIARSLGLPEVSVLAAQGLPSVVHVTVCWELCWYRYEVDLSDEVPSVRAAGQGYELNELSAAEREPNARADDDGMLSFGA